MVRVVDPPFQILGFARGDRIKARKKIETDDGPVPE
jgi:hypothetical protein